MSKLLGLTSPVPKAPFTSYKKFYIYLFIFIIYHIFFIFYMIAFNIFAFIS